MLTYQHIDYQEMIKQIKMNVQGKSGGTSGGASALHSLT